MSQVIHLVLVDLPSSTPPTLPLVSLEFHCPSLNRLFIHLLLTSYTIFLLKITTKCMNGRRLFRLGVLYKLVEV